MAVPVATASAAPPDPAQVWKNEAAGAIFVGVVVLVGLWFFADAFAPSFVKWLGMGAVLAILGALEAFGGNRRRRPIFTNSSTRSPPISLMIRFGRCSGAPGGAGTGSFH